MSARTLGQCMPEILNGCYDRSPAFKQRHALVKAEHLEDMQRWPGPHKNVHYWVELDSGKAVGWNENPATGWTFPVINYPHQFRIDHSKAFKWPK